MFGTECTGWLVGDVEEGLHTERRRGAEIFSGFMLGEGLWGRGLVPECGWGRREGMQGNNLRIIGGSATANRELVEERSMQDI